ncbi:MAG: hypothetical protein AB8B53_01840 [Flavobacteriales bacterium]
MIKQVFFFLAILGALSAFSQSSRFVYSLDTSYVPSNRYLEEYTLESYYASGAGNVSIEFGALESELLNAAVFYAFNKARTDRNKKKLRYEPQLDFLGHNCVHYFSKSKFRYSKRNELLYEKILYLAARKMPIKCHLFKANTGLVSLMDIEPKRKVHRNLEDHRSPYRLYYRNPPELKDDLEDIVEPLTYNQFAERVVESIYTRKTRKRLNSNSYETMACYVYIEPRSIRSNKPPYAKVIQIIGAKRLALD